MGQTKIISGSYGVVDIILTTTTRQAADLWRSLVRIEVTILLLGVVLLLVVWLGQ